MSISMVLLTDAASGRDWRKGLARGAGKKACIEALRAIESIGSTGSLLADGMQIAAKGATPILASQSSGGGSHEIERGSQSIQHVQNEIRSAWTAAQPFIKTVRDSALTCDELKPLVLSLNSLTDKYETMVPLSKKKKPTALDAKTVSQWAVQFAEICSKMENCLNKLD
jgi:hypothetical protein